MENEFRTIKVTILGKNYTLYTDDNEQDIINAVELVDKRMKEIVAAMQNKDGYTAAVLLALELAGELKKQEKNLGLWQKKASDLGSLLASKLS
ncbi:cell division protein ZapA [Candidatus Dependentiae bacterium]|nr:cell division protein ZapA [Candidatus Dependentiae bacterium]